jgi:acyl carrier protein
VVTGKDVRDLVLDVAKAVNPALGDRIDIDRGLEAPLLGPDTALDSLALITFVAAIEEAIAERFGMNVVVLDERAAKLTDSPYRTVGALVGYVEQLLLEGAA